MSRAGHDERGGGALDRASGHAVRLVEVAAIDHAVDDANTVETTIDGHRVLAVGGVVEGRVVLAAPLARGELVLVSQTSLHRSNVGGHPHGSNPPAMAAKVREIILTSHASPIKPNGGFLIICLTKGLFSAILLLPPTRRMG